MKRRRGACLVKLEGCGDFKLLSVPSLILTRPIPVSGPSVAFSGGELFGTGTLSQDIPLRASVARLVLIIQLPFLLLCQTLGSVVHGKSHVFLPAALERAVTIIPLLFPQEGLGHSAQRHEVTCRGPHSCLMAELRLQSSSSCLTPGNSAKAPW